MCTLEDIRSCIQPVPQQVAAGEGKPLCLCEDCKFSLSAPEAEKGPIKTATAEMKTFLQARYGDACFAPEGIPVTLTLGAAPETVKNADEGYRIRVNESGITVTGFGPSGLYYGVGSLKQMWADKMPAVEVLDWPDNPIRGFKEECRYGSNMMEREDWFALVDDLASKKINRLSIGLYGCWVVQYDGRVAEFLYVPVKDYPQLKTPQTVKYYSPTEDRWYNCETLPPIFRDNLLGDIVRYAKDRAIDVIPGINSFGHNTLFPRLLPEVSPKDENGEPTMTGFCTSSEETYKLLFSIYDQIIDEYLIPNEIYSFNILLDEVHEQFGVNAERMREKLSPWCKCEKCRDQDRGDIFIDHAIKVITYLKNKGMKTITMANDMLVGHSSQLGYLGDRMRKAVYEAGVQDVLLLGWWDYEDLEEKVHFDKIDDSLNMRAMTCPWNGYFSWCMLLPPMRNLKIMADMGHAARTNEGFSLYALWDKSYDFVHDCYSDYTWNYNGTVSPKLAIERYAARHFGPMQAEAIRAFRLIHWITEQRKTKKDPENPRDTVLSNYSILRGDLCYYPKTYLNLDEPYPRHFPGIAISRMLPWREDYERAFYSIAAMSKEAMEIFRKAARTEGCDQVMATRLAYECENYLSLVENWRGLLEIYDLTQSGDQKQIIPIARRCIDTQLAVMRHCEEATEKWVQRGAIMRNHSVLLAIFQDVLKYVESTDEPKLDLMDITAIMSEEHKMLR